MVVVAGERGGEGGGGGGGGGEDGQAQLGVGLREGPGGREHQRGEGRVLCVCVCMYAEEKRACGRPAYLPHSSTGAYRQTNTHKDTHACMYTQNVHRRVSPHPCVPEVLEVVGRPRVVLRRRPFVHGSEMNGRTREGWLDPAFSMQAALCPKTRGERNTHIHLHKDARLPALALLPRDAALFR